MRASVRRIAGPFMGLALLAPLFVSSCSNEHVVSIAVTPAEASVSQTGQTTQFEAIGTTNHPDVPPEDISSSVTWASSTTGVATINATGLATAVGCGTTTISATESGVVGQTTFTNTCGGGTTQGTPVLQSINIYPATPIIPQIGQTTQFIALGVYSSASVNNNLTTSAAWGSSNVGVAQITSTGLATAVSCGTTTITAQYQGVISSTTLTVACTVAPTPVLQSINLFPSTPTIPQLGETTQFIALAIYSPATTNNDLSKVASWASSNTAIATVGSAGLATAVSCGTTTITAEYQGVIGQTSLTVECTGTQTLQSIALFPSSPTVPQIGQTTQFLALGTLVQGGQTDLTDTASWGSSDAGVATVNGTGLATAVSCGTTTITASSQNITGATVLTVSCSAITSIELLVQKSGSLSGTVTSQPVGIDCGTVCGALFNEGTGIELIGVPTPSSWGGCDQVIAGACYFTLIPDASTPTQKLVTVTF